MTPAARFTAIALLAALLANLGCAQRSTPQNRAVVDDPRGAVISLFDRYDLVALSELHRNKEAHEFLRAVMRDPRLVEHGVTNVVVEFGSAKYQAVADRYAFGEDVPADDVRRIWRDTGQFLIWDSPLYEMFFACVRDVNRSLPREKKIRIVLGDPPIDWNAVHTKADYERFGDRDLFYAEVVAREVLNRGQKAILIAGGTHFLNARDATKNIPDRRRDAGDLIHRRHPGKLFAFWHVTEPPDRNRADRPGVWIVDGTPLAQQSFAPFAPKGLSVPKVVNGKTEWVPLEAQDWPTVSAMTDGLIYYGPTSTLVEAPAETYRDASYVNELRRRAAILFEVYGMDFNEQLNAALK